MNLLTPNLNKNLFSFLLLSFTIYGQAQDIDSLEQVLKSLPDDTSKVNTHYRLSKAYETEFQYANAMEIATAGLALGQKINFPKGVARMLIKIADINELMGNYPKAIQENIAALKIFEELDEPHSIAYVYISLGNIFRVEDDFEKSMHYYEGAMSIYQSLNNESGIMRTMNNIGLIYGELHQYDSALNNFYQVLKATTQTGDKYGMAISCNNLGKDYRNLAKYDSALKYSGKAYEIQLELEDKYGQGLSLSNLAEIFLLQKNYPIALEHAQSGYAIANEINNKRLQSRMTNLIYQTYEGMGNYKDAFKYLQLYKVYEDSLFDNKKTRDIANMELTYGLDKKEQQITALQKESEIDELKKNMLIGSVVGTIFLAILIYLFQSQRIRKNRQIIEKGKEVDRAKSRFFANISHEFRTPLTLILGPIEEIREKVPDRQTHLYLNMMQKHARKLLNQVNQLLDLSKLDSNQLNLHIVREDFVSFVKGITMCFQSLALSRNIDLTFTAEQPKVMAYFDKDCMEKIMVNLLSNAFKFTVGPGQILVEIKASKDQIELKITDTGQGIDLKEQNLIFERYYHTESDMQASSGIGLALVKELVTSHHGVISVDSTKGKGSTFIVSLPIIKNRWKNLPVFEGDIHGNGVSQNGLDYEFEVAADENDLPALGSCKTVLVIEDNEDVRLFIKEVLKDQMKVIEAENGEAGIKMGEELLPDIILVDIMMPGVDGYEVVKQLKQSEKTSHIPIIMLTARADMDSKLKGLDIEADDFMTKPFDRKELTTRILNLIKSREKLTSQFSQITTFKSTDLQISSIDQVFLEKIIEAIEENIDNNSFGVEELAGIVGMSRSQLHRKLQVLVGQPPNKLIRSVRLSRAMELLKNNAGTVADIAFMTGFSSPNYFNKCFKDQFGFAPGEVKKTVL